MKDLRNQRLLGGAFAWKTLGVLEYLAECGHRGISHLDFGGIRLISRNFGVDKLHSKQLIL